MARFTARFWLGVVIGANAGFTASPARADKGNVLNEVDRIVKERFYSPEALRTSRWDERVQQARKELKRTGSALAPDGVFSNLLASLGTSHTEYIPRADPRFWELASIYEAILSRPTNCPDASYLPSFPVARDEIGVLWKAAGKQWFVAGVYDDGPAKTSGLMLGDEVVSADGKPFEPINSLKDKAGQSIRLGIRRVKGEALKYTNVVPRLAQPQEAFRTALKSSARVIQDGDARIGYIRVWSWAGQPIQQELRSAINVLNDSRPTAFILDIRDGWGGAWPHDVAIFNPNVPVLESTKRSGQVFRTDTQIRVPAVLLVNGGSRSGKETVAYSVKKHRLATLIGERTAGAMLPGTAFCLSNGALLYVATASMTIDGEILEGRGVQPDMTVPFEIRYAQGHDPQLDAAIKFLKKAAPRH